MGFASPDSEENMRHVRNGVRYERTRVLQLIAELRAEWEQTREASTYTQAAHNGYLAVTKALDELRAKVEGKE